MKPRGKREPPALPFEKVIKKGVTSYRIPEAHAELFTSSRHPRNRKERLLKFREDLVYYKKTIYRVRKELIEELNYAEYLMEDLSLLHGEHGDIIQETVRHCERTAKFLIRKLDQLEERGKDFRFSEIVGSPLRQIRILRNIIERVEERGREVRSKYEDELRDEAN